MTSPSGPWRVNTEVDIEKNHTNNSGESKTANKLNNLKNSTVKNNCVKRQLQYPVENQSMISGNVLVIFYLLTINNEIIQFCFKK